MKTLLKYDFNTIISYTYRVLWWMLNRWKYDRIGLKSIIIKPLKITPSSIRFGRNVYVYKHCRIEGIRAYNNIKYSPLIIFNDNVTVQQNLHLTCANSIEIGKFTAIAANVTITDIHHSYLNINIPIENQDIIVKSVTIGENCKIYNNAVILPGVKIGDHVTIGANSVVSNDIPSYCVAVGSPARIIKMYNFSSMKWE